MLENKLKVLNGELNEVNDIADYYRSMRFNNTYFNYQTKTKNHNNHQILDSIKYAMKNLTKTMVVTKKILKSLENYITV